MTENTKHFIISAAGDATVYPTFDDAVAQARRYVGDVRRRNNGDSYNVYEVVANVTSVVPEAIVTKI